MDRIKREHIKHIIDMWIYKHREVFWYEYCSCLFQDKPTIFFFNSLKELVRKYNVQFNTDIRLNDVEKLLILI
jgi:hypothetical protein